MWGPHPQMCRYISSPKTLCFFSPDNKPPVFFSGQEHQSLCCILMGRNQGIHLLFFFFNFLLCIEVQLINNVVIVSGGKPTQFINFQSVILSLVPSSPSIQWREFQGPVGTLPCKLACFFALPTRAPICTPQLANSAFSCLPSLLLQAHLPPSFQNTVAFGSYTVPFVLMSLGPVCLWAVQLGIGRYIPSICYLYPELCI